MWWTQLVFFFSSYNSPRGRGIRSGSDCVWLLHRFLSSPIMSVRTTTQQMWPNTDVMTKRKTMTTTQFKTQTCLYKEVWFLSLSRSRATNIPFASLRKDSLSSTISIWDLDKCKYNLLGFINDKTNQINPELRMKTLTCLSSSRTCLVSSILFLLTCLMATRFPWEETPRLLWDKNFWLDVKRGGEKNTTMATCTSLKKKRKNRHDENGDGESSGILR